jgi:hypothetical protein
VTSRRCCARRGSTRSTSRHGARRTRRSCGSQPRSIILDGDRLAIRDAHAKEHRFDNELGYQACFDEAIAHFVSALIAGTAFETEGEDNVQTLRLVEDSYGPAAPDRVH